METSHNNGKKTGFNFKVSSYSIVARTIKHLTKCSSILVNNFRKCPPSSRKKPNLGTILIHISHAVSMPCCVVTLKSLFQSGMVGDGVGHDRGFVNETWSRCVNQMGTTHYKYLVTRHDMCQLALKVCRTTHCVKAFLSFKPLAFTPVPPAVTASELIARTQ